MDKTQIKVPRVIHVESLGETWAIDMTMASEDQLVGAIRHWFGSVVHRAGGGRKGAERDEAQRKQAERLTRWDWDPSGARPRLSDEERARRAALTALWRGIGEPASRAEKLAREPDSFREFLKAAYKRRHGEFPDNEQLTELLKQQQPVLEQLIQRELERLAAEKAAANLFDI